MRILSAGVFTLLLVPVGLAQNNLELKDLQRHPFNVEFASGSDLRMHLQSGHFRVIGRDDNRISVHFEGKNVEKARNLTVRFTRSDQGGDLRVFRAPKNDLQVTIEIPMATDITVRMRGGDLNLDAIIDGGIALAIGVLRAGSAVQSRRTVPVNTGCTLTFSPETLLWRLLSPRGETTKALPISRA